MNKKNNVSSKRFNQPPIQNLTIELNELSDEDLQQIVG
jgi:bacteriocin-like protein